MPPDDRNRRKLSGNGVSVHNINERTHLLGHDEETEDEYDANVGEDGSYHGSDESEVRRRRKQLLRYASFVCAMLCW